MENTAIMGSERDGWIMVIISTMACILGASVVFIDSVLKRPQGTILENHSFLAGSLALASGVLLFSSLSILLPVARQRLGSDMAAYSYFFGGALFTLLITRIIHYCTPKAIHACGVPPGHHENGNVDSPEHARLCGHQSPHHHHHHHHHNHNHNHNHHNHYHDDTSYGTLNESHFRTHTSTPVMDLRHFYAIGLQTAIAIGIHKFPGKLIMKGLVMFVSSQASTSLGISVATAMAIHNFTEGFMIAYPLYFALRSRVAAFCCASLLGGMSLPVGAIIGVMILNNITEDQKDFVFGATFALVSGMMTFITIQSMLPQALRAESRQYHVLLFVFIGIFLVGCTSMLESL